MYENEILLVEKLLESYPVRWRRNYYNNKKTLKINKLDSILGTVYGEYNEEKNLITLYNDTALIHELFHSCFRDGEKLNKQVDEFYYSNGITMKNKNNNIKYGVALTEGFVEYLSRKISISKGYDFEYFIVDLLISIYGEDILKYPFTNDVIGFYEDERFYKIVDLLLNLDLYQTYYRTIKEYIEYSEIIIEKKDKKTDKGIKLVKEIMDEINKMIKELYNSIIKCINLIIREYKNCKCPMIEKEDFVLKLRQYLVNPDYQVVVTLLMLNKCDLNKKVQKILERF